MLKVDDLRKKYPSPATYNKHRIVDGSYCVGGALCLEMGALHDEQRQPFPDHDTLADALETANPILRETDEHGLGMSDYYAEEIISANDEDADFERAWAVLNEALSYEI